MSARRDMPPLRLGPQATSLLVLVAGYHALSPEEWLMRAIATEGERIGVGGLAGVQTRFLRHRESGEPCPDGRAGEERETRSFAGPSAAEGGEGAPPGPRKGADGRSALRALPGRGDQS